MSAADAQRVENHPEAAKAVTTHIETRGVNFDRASGLAQTDQKLTFAFRSGSGQSIGLTDKPEEGWVRLLRDVRFTLKQSAPSAAKPIAGHSEATPPQEMQVKGSSLDFGRDSRLLHLFGPAEAQTAAERMSAGEVKLSLDKQFHAETLVASGTGANRPAVMSQGTRDQVKLEGDTLTAHFTPEGAVTRVDAAGAVRGTRDGAAEHRQGQTGNRTLGLWPPACRAQEGTLD